MKDWSWQTLKSVLNASIAQTKQLHRNTRERRTLMAPKYRIDGTRTSRFAGESRVDIGSRAIARSSVRRSSRKPQKRFAFAALPSPLATSYTRFIRFLYSLSAIGYPPGGIPYSQDERRGGESRRPSARKSGAFHTLFMKYIFQQNSSTTCTQPRSDKIDGNVYILGDVKKLTR